MAQWQKTQIQRDNGMMAEAHVHVIEIYQNVNYDIK